MFDKIKRFLRRLFGKRNPDLVPYHDFESRSTVWIPKAELSSGAIFIQIRGHAHPVYADSAQLKQGGYQHSPFEGAARSLIQTLVTDLADVYPLSFEEWEDGFRRDLHPEREIAGWIHLASVLKVVAAKFNFEPPEKQECFRVLLACFTAERSTVRECSDPKLLSAEQFDLAVKYYYEGGN